MIKNIDQKLACYSKINFDNDLINLENDVRQKLDIKQANCLKPKNLVENWFGVPIPVSVSALAYTLILGIFLGMQMQSGVIQVKSDSLGFDVFSVTNINLPSSLLAPK